MTCSFTVPPVSVINGFDKPANTNAPMNVLGTTPGKLKWSYSALKRAAAWGERWSGIP